MGIEALRRLWFALIYRVVDPPLRLVTRRARRSLLADLAGDVLEVGSGPGANFEHYPREARVTAIDINERLVALARREAARVEAKVTARHADAEALPFDDASFDAYVAALVLCSVRDPNQALVEARRILRPGGELRLFEHVRSDVPWITWLQSLATRPWRVVADGCHLDRDTEAAVRSRSFEVMDVRRSGRWSPVPVIVLRARKPGTQHEGQAGFTAET